MYTEFIKCWANGKVALGHHYRLAFSFKSFVKQG